VSSQARRLGSSWVVIACVLSAAAIVAISGITWLVSPYWGRNAQAATRQVGTLPTTAGKAIPLAPNRIEIPKLKVRAPIIAERTGGDGELQIPLNPKIVGWWAPGAKPGARRGTAILAGHINYSGVTGAMAAIGSLNPGDAVYVFGRHNANHKAEVRFRVTGVRTYHKTALPYREIFDQKSIGRLAIVTCGGPFDASTGNYVDNVVVYAVPV
jgi:hypothetical protein